MGIFSVDCEVVNIQEPDRKVRAATLLVDSGSESSWIPQKILKQIGIRVFKKNVSFVMANGKTINRSVGYALLKAKGFKTVDEVVFGQPGDLPLLGSRTLEGFGALVDSRKKKLVPAEPYPAASARGGFVERRSNKLRS